MNLQILAVAKFLLAHGAFVFGLMARQCILSFQHHRAGAALKFGRPNGMGHFLMHIQGGRVQKFLVALLTSEWHHTSMLVHVGYQPHLIEN